MLAPNFSPASMVFARAPGVFALLFCHAGLAHEFSGPQGTVEVDWAGSNIDRIQSAGYGDVFGIEAAVKMGFPEKEIVEGRYCVRSSLFLFDATDEFAFDIDATRSTYAAMLDQP